MLVKIKFTFSTGELTIKNTFEDFEQVAHYLAYEKLAQENNGIWATDIKIEILAYKGENNDTKLPF